MRSSHEIAGQASKVLEYGASADTGCYLKMRSSHEIAGQPTKVLEYGASADTGCYLSDLIAFIFWHFDDLLLLLFLFSTNCAKI